MTTETVNILALILGFLALIVPLVVTWHLSRKTDRLIQAEDERAKVLIRETQRMIDEGNARVERMIEEGKKDTQMMIKETQRMIEEGNARTERMIEEGRKETRELISYMVKILEGMERRAEERHKELVFK